VTPARDARPLHRPAGLGHRRAPDADGHLQALTGCPQASPRPHHRTAGPAGREGVTFPPGDGRLAPRGRRAARGL